MSTIPGCATYTSLVACKECRSSYSLSYDNTACVTTITGCASHNPDGTCETCSPHFLLSPNKKSCEERIPGCSSYNSDETCLTCNAGTSLSNDSMACVTTIPGCASHNPNGTCKDCSPTYSLSISGDACVLCQVSNCTHCNATNVCLTCADGLGLSDAGACVACVEDNCKQCSDNGNTCLAYLVTEEKKENGLPWWAYLCIALGCLLLIGLIVFLILFLCRDKGEDPQPTSKGHAAPQERTRSSVQRGTTAGEGSESDSISFSEGNSDNGSDSDWL
ncbi:hypothetical protein AGDE_16627 [Angomonas deanei]|nr:hypothetical protein AGDE_16627 [Angomonas deanei]|eukprot:EPY16744.1 hypothetical protein AGDE_16627 [Angomonas deanei]